MLPHCGVNVQIFNSMLHALRCLNCSVDAIEAPRSLRVSILKLSLVLIQVVLEQPAGALRCARRGETEHRIPEQKAKVPGNGRRTRGSESQGRRNQEWQEQSSNPSAKSGGLQ